MPKGPFWKAFDIMMHNEYVTPSQKLALIVLTSNWPKVFAPTNAKLSEYTHQSIRTIQYNLKSLSTGSISLALQGRAGRRPLIRRIYWHEYRHTKPFTLRAFSILSFPVDGSIKLPWSSAPKNLISDPSLTPAQKLYLIEENRYGVGKYPYTLRRLSRAIGLPFAYTKKIHRSLSVRF